MNIVWSKLEKEDSNIFKGVAILMIAIHNFMHLFPQPKENEFEFNQARFFDFIYLVTNDPLNIAQPFFSFFGHFGVQIFIFLSAYGLTKKYSNFSFSYFKYFWERIKKIYPMFLLSILAWGLFVGWGSGLGFWGPVKIFYLKIDELILKLLLVSNFIDGQAFSLVGPWWFLSLIFQFYIVFPFLLFIYSKGRIFMMLILSVLNVLLLIVIEGKIAQLNVYFTILGHLPEFCLGICFAKVDNNNININIFVVILALTVNLLGNIYECFWFVSHFSFIVMILPILSVLTRKIKRNSFVKKVFVYLGVISMPIFFVNGFLRRPLIELAIYYDVWYLNIVFCFVFLVICILLARSLYNIEKNIRLMCKKAFV